MDLNPQQQAAAVTDSRMALVLAGAGAGKTRVMVKRVAHLVREKKVSPSEILVITFTRKAANELDARLRAEIGNQAYSCPIGTIHAVALGLLRRFGEFIGLKGQALTIYSEWETDYLQRECARDLGLYNGKAWKVSKRDIDAMWLDLYARGLEPDADHPARPLYNEMIRRCRENNALTYGGIILGLRLLIPQIKQYLGWKHILIDETQDNDLLQWEIVLTLAQELKASLFAVGDVDQSIYAFRGAAPEWLVQHQSLFDVYRLETNYRSSKGIVEAANRLIERNAARLPKTMIAWDDSPHPIPAPLMGMDSSAIARFVDHRLGGVASPRDLAVLARTHVLLERVAEELERLEIPHERIGAKTELTRSEPFRRFHAFLKLCVNPFDNFSFLLIRELVGVSREEYDAIRLKAAREAKSHFQAWREMDDPQDAGTWAQWFAGEKSLESAAASLLDALPQAGFDIDAAAACAAFVIAWTKANPLRSIADYLAWLATFDVQDEISAAQDDGAGKVTLMTIHAAKGLEWPVVIVAGCNEGILPSKRAVTPEDIEDERRLAYVAMTRAERELVLAVRPERKEGANGRVYDNPRSRFVAEALGQAVISEA